MTNDPIADLLIQIKNGYLAHKKDISLPHSKIKETIAKILQRSGFLGKIEVKDNQNLKIFKIELIYLDKKPKFTDVVRISKPGRRVYVNYKSIPKVLGGMGLSLISTPQGVMTDKEARKKKLGGELVCKIW